MAINKKLIIFETKEQFTKQLSSIANTSIVFIKDAGELWTHGKLFAGKISSVDNKVTITLGGETVEISKYGHTHSYLPLSGGTLTGGLTINGNYNYILKLNNSGDNSTNIQFSNSTGELGWIGVSTDHNPVFRLNATSTVYKILTEQNYQSVIDSRYVKKTGDTMTGGLNIKGANTSSGRLIIQTSGREDQMEYFQSSTTNRGGVNLKDNSGTDHTLYLTQTELLWKNNKVWHAGNLSPVTTNTEQTITANKLFFIDSSTQGFRKTRYSNSGIQIACDSTNWASGVHFYTDVSTDSVGTQCGGIGALGTSKGAITGLYMSIGNEPWNSGKGLFITNANITFRGNKVWHAGNDGSGSGLDADLLDGKHLSDILCWRGDTTSTNGSTTLWSNTGIKQYDNALPDGLTGVYPYGQVVTFATNTNRFEFYCSHISSDSTNEQRGLYFRSGYANDKRSWTRILTFDDYATLDGKYVNVTGDTMTGPLKINTSNLFGFELINPSNAEITYRVVTNGSTNRSAFGWRPTTGTYMFSYGSTKYLAITDGGELKFGSGASNDSKVWYEGNDGSGSGLDADLLDGQQGSRYLQCLGGPNYITITVGGDANTYYPVVISSVSSYYPLQFINISRHYYETAPDSWNTATHKGGLTMTLLWNGSKFWDGNGSGAIGEYLNCIFLKQTYSKIVGGLDISVEGAVVWLRGGTAAYHIHSMGGTSTTASVHLSTFTDKASRTFSPTTSISTINIRWPGVVESAEKIGTETVGGILTPIYLNAGTPTACSASSSATASTIAVRDGSGDIQCRLVRPNFANQTTISGAIAYRVNNSTDNYIRFCSDPAAVRTWLGAAASSHTHSYLPLAGGTMTGAINTYAPKGMWISGKTSQAIKYNSLAAIDSSSYWAFLGMKSASGNVLSFGGLGDSIGFYGYKAATTANQTDYSLACNTSNGVWNFSVTPTIGGKAIATQEYVTSQKPFIKITSTNFSKNNGDTVTSADSTALDQIYDAFNNSKGAYVLYGNDTAIVNSIRKDNGANQYIMTITSQTSDGCVILIASLSTNTWGVTYTSPEPYIMTTNFSSVGESQSVTSGQKSDLEAAVSALNNKRQVFARFYSSQSLVPAQVVKYNNLYAVWILGGDGDIMVWKTTSSNIWRGLRSSGHRTNTSSKSSGYMWLREGLMIQWGFGATTGAKPNKTIVFPYAYKRAPNVYITADRPDEDIVPAYQVAYNTSTSFMVIGHYTKNGGGTWRGDPSFNWLAIGEVDAI